MFGYNNDDGGAMVCLGGYRYHRQWEASFLSQRRLNVKYLSQRSLQLCRISRNRANRTEPTITASPTPTPSIRQTNNRLNRACKLEAPSTTRLARDFVAGVSRDPPLEIAFCRQDPPCSTWSHAPWRPRSHT